MVNTDRLISILEQAESRLPGPDRDGFLAEACAGDPELKEQVISLLQSHESAGDFLTNTVIPPAVFITEKPGDLIGRYRLLEKVGEGGCGVVYVAEQTEPVRRRVALKVIKLGMDTKQVIARFEAERQALALMDHPNIAKVLDAGSTETGRPYFVMELVRGIAITHYCEQNSLSTVERLELFIKVCNAIQHAHQKGIIHRDIKPSNILVTLHDGIPVPRVIDFGIAKAIEGKLSDATVYTQLLQFVGTPAYMSPEQAELSGLDIDTRSDIYSLGVLLYELLTSKTPFDAQQLIASGLDAMRKTIRETEPVRPSTRLTQQFAEVELIPRKATGGLAIPSEAEATAEFRAKLRLKEQINRVRGDLDWIVMKCLEKNRTRRYDTANGLAADLQRHLTSEPVVARPPTPLYRFQKTVRRNKLVFASAGAVLAALCVGLFVAFWQAIRATKAKQTALRAEGQIRRNAYAAEISVAFHALAESNLGRARELLDRQRPKVGEDDLRGFEWRYLWRLCQGDEFVTFTNAGARAVSFSPDGKLLVFSDFNKIIVREAASQRVLTTLPSPAVTLSFAPHRNLVASGHASGVKLWNTDTWQMERLLGDTVEPSLFSPDGRWLLTGGAGAFRLWDTQTWQPVGVCPGAPQLAHLARNVVAFSPDSQFVVTVAGEGKIGDHLRVWRLPSMERVLPDIRIEGEKPGSVAFSADGKYLTVGLWNGQLVVLDFATREVRPTTKEHTACLTAIAFASNGQTFVTSSSDRTVNLWDATTFKHLTRLRGHVGEVWCVAISPDGRIVGSGSDEGRPWMSLPTTKLWSTSTRHSDPVLEGSSFVAGSLDGGRRVVAVTTNGWCVWTPESGARMDFPVPPNPTVVPWGKPYDVKPDESLGALGRSDGSIEIWNLSTGARVTAWPAHRDPISVIAFSSQGRRLASGTTNGEVKIWDFAARREVMRLGPMDCYLFCLAFSPDDETLAVSGDSTRVWLWNATTGTEVRQLGGHGENVPSVAFSSNGKLLATTTFVANEARLWELPSGKELAPLKGHVSGVTTVAFSPDGKTLVTGGFDKKVKLWDLSTHQELVTLSLGGEYPTLRFSPDGSMLMLGNVVGDYGRIHILRAPSFEEIAAAEANADRTKSAAR